MSIQQQQGDEEQRRQEEEAAKVLATFPPVKADWERACNNDGWLYSGRTDSYGSR